MLDIVALRCGKRGNKTATALSHCCGVFRVLSMSCDTIEVLNIIEYIQFRRLLSRRVLEQRGNFSWHYDNFLLLVFKFDFSYEVYLDLPRHTVEALSSNRYLRFYRIVARSGLVAQIIRLVATNRPTNLPTYAAQHAK
jgi:hypothetical protein